MLSRIGPGHVSKGWSGLVRLGQVLVGLGEVSLGRAGSGQVGMVRLGWIG